jgi:hypothetical protein
MATTITVPRAETVDAKTLKNAHNILVYDENGHSMEFGSLFAEQKTIVVFIREWVYCCGLAKSHQLFV